MSWDCRMYRADNSEGVSLQLDLDSPLEAGIVGHGLLVAGAADAYEVFKDKELVKGSKRTRSAASAMGPTNSPPSGPKWKVEFQFAHKTKGHKVLVSFSTEESASAFGQHLVDSNLASGYKPSRKG